MGTVDVQLTLAEAAQVLDPAISERALRDIITALRIPAAGVRRNGHAGRPAFAYDAAGILKLHAAISPWLAEGSHQEESALLSA